MEKWIALLSDLSVIIFDLLLYIQMTVLRKNNARSRRILYTGCAVIIVFYILATAVFSLPVAVSAFVCMTLPSLALFWVLCKYRDARFFLTFCFVDTVSLIIGFIVRYIGMVSGTIGNIIAIALMLLLLVFVYKKGKPYFKRYRDTLEFIDSGWKRLTISAALIYIALIFIASYPKPLMERQEYVISYLVISVMVLSFYTVFLTSIATSRKVYEQSIRLKEQQKWFEIAYVDALTEIPNRMAYMKKIHELERMEDQTVSVAIIVMDLDHLKTINDTQGHNSGDKALKQVAEYLSDTFLDENSTVYRIGGDEFVVITVGVKEDEILNKLVALGKSRESSHPFSISAGYSFVDRSEKNAVEQAFARADAMMYENKHKNS